MSFIKKKIESEKIGILDIGCYKIKFSIGEIKSNDIQLISYSSKRQNSDDLDSNGIKNIKSLCENINITIDKSEKEINSKVENIVVNFPTCDIFFISKKINYKRKNPEDEIKKDEIKKIIKKTGKIILEKSLREIENKHGYTKDGLKLIISNILQIKLDNKKVKDLKGGFGENISISILNIFIPYEKYNAINYIGNITGKNIIKIIPSEFALSNLIEENKVVIIDIGSNSTSITIKKDHSLIGVHKFSLGIEDLIKKIQQNNNIVKIDIINSIDEDKFIEEKNNFLSIFKDYLETSINDIMGDEICPNIFFITGGGANKFIKKYIKNELNENSKIKLAQKIDFIKSPVKNLDKTNTNIASMILTIEKLIENKNNLINKSLKKVIEEEGY